MLRSSTIQSPQLKRRKKKIFYILTASAVVVVGLLIAGLSWLSKLDAFQVRSVVAEGNALITEDQIWQEIESMTDGNYLKLFSKRNTLLFPKRRVLASVAAKFPIFEGAEIDIKNLNTVRLKVTERKPHSLWCAYENSDNPFGDRCFFVDARGYAYSVAPEFKGAVYMKYYAGFEGDTPIGQSFLTSERFAALAEFVDQVRKLDLYPLYIYAKPDNDFEMTLRGGGKILFNENEGLEKTLINLQTVIDENKSASMTSVSMKSSSTPQLGSDLSTQIQYIDLRFGNKIYFKWR